MGGGNCSRGGSFALDSIPHFSHYSGTPFQTWREEVMTMKENIAAIWGATSPQYASALTVISQVGWCAVYITV
mgnify:CR=1 FL=1